MPIAAAESAKYRRSEAPRVGKVERHGNLNCNGCERGTALGRFGALLWGRVTSASGPRFSAMGRADGADTEAAALALFDGAGGMAGFACRA